MTAREYFNAGTSWSDEIAREALPVLIRLAESGKTLTYSELEQQVAFRLNRSPLKVVVSYGKVLEKVGGTLNLVSAEWKEEIPPLTILVLSMQKGLPSSGVDGFLNRYVTESIKEHLTENNRNAMIKRATEAVHNFERWQAVAAYLGIEEAGTLAETEAIMLPQPQPIRGGESQSHLTLKQYIAQHPELFIRYGQFPQGEVEVVLPSGDEVDVLFRATDQTLAVEVKTADAPAGELTRGIFQAVKYRAVLRAMHDIAGELCKVQVVLVTPQTPLLAHADAAKRLQVKWQQIRI